MVVQSSTGHRADNQPCLQVSQQPGGVARNISYALSRLIPAQSLKLVSVVGKDAAGSALLRLWDNHNERSTSGILISASNRTATVATVMAGNEIYAGIADTGRLHLDGLTVRMEISNLY